MSAPGNAAFAGHVADLLPGFVNGTLKRADRDQVMRHLPGCPVCATDLKAWQAIREATLAATAQVPAAPEGILSGVWAVLDNLESGAVVPAQGRGAARSPQLSIRRRQRQGPKLPEDAMSTYALLVESVIPPRPSAPAFPTPRQVGSSLRRYWPSLVAVAALLLLAVAGFLLPNRLDGTGLGGLLPLQQNLPPDVSMARGNPARSGELPGPGPAAKPEILWQAQTGGQVRSVPALGDGVLYVVSEDGTVHAFDHATGEERWRFDTGGAPVANPTVVDGVVYIGDANPSLGDGHGTLFALAADTGAELWRLPDAQAQSPLVVDGVVYVGIGDGFFLALDAKDGTERWRAETGAIARGATLAVGVVYVGGTDGHVYALDAATGAERWRYLTEGGTLGTIAAADGMVYEAAFDGPADQLYALDAATGEERWRFAAGARVQPPAVGGGIVYLPAGDGSLYALDAGRGTLRWRFPVEATEVDAPALVADTVYVSGEMPTLYAVDAASGDERWHIDLDGTLGAAPIVSGGVVYVGTETGSFYALGERAEDPPLAIEAPSDTGSPAGPAAFLWAAANGSEPIDQPHGMAVAANGNLWVVEGGANRILIFSPDGAFLEAWGAPGPSEGEFNFNLENLGGAYGGVAFDKDGTIFVADSGNFRIQKFDRNRNFLTAWGSEGNADGQFLGPVHLATDAQGNVSVSDFGGIQKFSGDGTFLGRIGRRGSGEGDYSCTAVFGIDALDNIFVPDCENHRVMKFAPDGSLVMTLGEEGKDPGQFTFPVSVAVDAAGRIYVADSGNNRVQVFDGNGQYLTEWGTFGAAAGQLSGPGAVALDGEGNIYVQDFNNGRVQKFRLQPPLAEAGESPEAS